MGDGFTAQDVVDITEGTYEETLSWDASGDTAALAMALTFTEDAAVWREGTYYDADGHFSLTGWVRASGRLVRESCDNSPTETKLGRKHHLIPSRRVAVSV